MADTTYIRGNDVPNATSYELFERTGDAYNSLATAEHISFEVSAMGLEEGDHYLVVKAHADGYESSDFSNEVFFNVPEAPIANLYNPEDYPVQMAYYGNSFSVSTASLNVVSAGGNRVTKTVGVDVCEFPVEAGKTYSIKLYNAPTTAIADGDTNNDGTSELGPTEIPCFGIVGFFFYETIDGKPSIRYAYSLSNNPRQVAYWSTSKQGSYTGHIPISETNNPDVFAITKTHNPDTIIITNLATGAKNTDSDKSVFGPAASMYSQSCQIEIKDESITHMTILFGNPSNTTYQWQNSAGVLSTEDQAAAIQTYQNGLMIVEGKKLPTNYMAYEG